MKSSVNNGFTLVEMLISLMILTMGLNMISSTLPIIQHISQIHIPIEEEIALKQLRQLIALSSEVEVYDTYLEFWYLSKHSTLLFEHDRIIRKSGTVIYMEDVDDASFKEKGGCIYLYYERKEKQNEVFLGCTS